MSRHLAEGEQVVRFVVRNGVREPRWLPGLVGVAENLLKTDSLEVEARAAIRVYFDWIDEVVPVPRYRHRRHLWGSEAVCWIRSSAFTFVQRTREVARHLVRNGHAMAVVQTGQPGEICYKDAYQVIADTPPSFVADRREVEDVEIAR